MSSASTPLKENFESNAIPSQLESAPSNPIRPSSPATPSYPPGERLLNTSRRSRRKVISFATSQATAASIAAAVHNAQPAFSDDTIMEDFTDSQPEVAQVTTSEDTIVTDAAAIPPECEAIQTSAPWPIKVFKIDAQLPGYDTEISPKPKEKFKGNETRKGKGKQIASKVMFPNLARSSSINLLEPEDMSHYIADAPPLYPQEDAPTSPSSKDKGKGKATDNLSQPLVAETQTSANLGRRASKNQHPAEKLASSVKRRLANYAISHPPGWFDGLPQINEELFKDSPHKEYKVVLIHTARCNVCLQYNKGTLFLCTDCTASICDGCADRKCDDGAASGVAGDDVVVATAKETSGEDAIGTTGCVGTIGEAADVTEPRLDWCGPYHEVFRGAYLQWKATIGVKDGFMSAEGVEFKPGTGKKGGRKEKATR